MTLSGGGGGGQECAIRSAPGFSLFLILPVPNIYEKGNGIK